MMKIGNVTVDPSSQALAVVEPEIKEVLELATGRSFKAVEIITSHRYDELIKLRNHVREHLNTDAPIYACEWCSTPAYIVANKHKRFFFRHKEEDGSCPAETRGMSQEEIRARKYHGQRESSAHKQLKRLIERSLMADPEFDAIKLEKVWRAARDPKSRRQPDVQAIQGDQRIAFEGQLSTTFLDVVVGRRTFYRNEGALLIWIVGSFFPEYRRLTTDDLLFSNNSNILVVDDETTRMSEETKVFHTRCFFRRPARQGDDIVETWENQVIRFSQLNCDRESQTAFLFDFEGEEKRLRQEILAEQTAKRNADDAELRQHFVDLWLDVEQNGFSQEARILWDPLRMEFERRGIPLGVGPFADGDMRALLNGLLSAQAGRPIGWKFKKLIEVAHWLAEGSPQHLFAFGHALKLYGNDASLLEQDRSGRWKNRLKEVRPCIERYEPQYLPDERSLSVVEFLFPEIGQKVRAWPSRSSIFI
jgi:Family of unknown function (DUF6035)